MTVTAQQLQDMLVSTVACGDPTLTALMTDNIGTLWGLHDSQQLELKYLYTQADMVAVAMDYARMQVDTYTRRESSNNKGGYQQSGYRDVEGQKVFQGASNSFETATRFRQFVRSTAAADTLSLSESMNGSGSYSLTGQDNRSNSGGESISGSVRQNGAKNTSLDNTRYHRKLVQTNTATGTDGVSQSPDNAGSSYMYKEQVGISIFGTSLKIVLSQGWSRRWTGTGVESTTEGAMTQWQRLYESGSKSASGSNSYTLSNTSRLDHTASRDTSRSNSSTGSLASSRLATSSRSGDSNEGSDEAAHSQAEHSASGSSNSVVHFEGTGSSRGVSTATYERKYWGKMFDNLEKMWQDVKTQIQEFQQAVISSQGYSIVSIEARHVDIIGNPPGQQYRYIKERPQIATVQPNYSP